MGLREDLIRQEGWKKFPYKDSTTRIEALINLTFNMGLGKLKQFKKFLAALEEGRWEDAVKELLYTGENKTPYYVQVGKRAEKVAAQILEG